MLDNQAEPSAEPVVAEAPPVPAALSEVDPAKLAELREKMAKFIAGKGKTVSGAEAPEDAAPEQVKQEASGPPLGRDVDWDSYDLDFNIKHLYPKAMLRQVNDGGVHWVAMIDEFHSSEKRGRNYGDMVHNANDSDPDSKTEPVNLGEYLTAMVNGPEGWKIAALLPCGSQTTVVLQRQVPYVLPDPKPLQSLEDTEKEVEVPADEELARMEQAALAFASGEGLAAPEIEEAIELPAEKLGTMHVQPLPPEEEHAAVREALSRNEGITEAAPAGEQPDALEVTEPWFGQTKVAAGVANIAVGLGELLKGEDFGDLDTSGR